MRKELLVWNPEYPEAERLGRLAADGIEGHPEVGDVLDYGKTRNRVLAFTYEGKRYVVKYFGKPKFPATLLSLFCKRSKARKSYDNSMTVINSGFRTATPIAFWEKRVNGILRESCYLSEALDLSLVSMIYDESYPEDMRHKVMTDLAEYTFELHSAGLWPKDFNIGNLLLDLNEKSGRHNFWLIDLNRFRAGKIPDLKKAMLSFDQLGVRPKDYQYSVAPYAALRGWELEECIRRIERYHSRYARLKKFKRLFRRKDHENQ